MGDDTDRALNLAIQLKVIGREDAQALKQLLGETKDAAGDLGQSTPEGWAGLEKYKNVLAESGVESGRLEEHIHGLRVLMSRAGPEAAELGHLLHFALNPLMLGGLVAAGGLELYFKWLEKIEDRHKQMILDLAKIGDEQRKVIAAGGNMTENMIAATKATSELRAEWDGLGESIKRIEATEKVYNLAAMDALEERKQSRNEELNILQDQINLLEALHKITPAQAEQDKLAVDHQKKIADINADVDKKKAEYFLAQSDREKTASTAGDFSADAVEKKRLEAEGAQQAANQSAEAIKGDGQAIADQNTLLQQQKARANDPGLFPGQRDEAVKGEIEAQKQIYYLQAQLDAANANYKGQQDAATASQKDYETLKSLHDKFEAMDAHIVELRQAYIDAQQGASKATAAENQQFFLQSLTALFKNGDTQSSIYSAGADAIRSLVEFKNNGGDVRDLTQRGQQDQRKQQAGLPLTDAETNDLAAYQSLLKIKESYNKLILLLTALGENSTAFVTAIATSKDIHHTTTAQMTKINDDLNTLQQQTQQLAATGNK